MKRFSLGALISMKFACAHHSFFTFFHISISNDSISSTSMEEFSVGTSGGFPKNLHHYILLIICLLSYNCLIYKLIKF